MADEHEHDWNYLFADDFGGTEKRGFFKRCRGCTAVEIVDQPELLEIIFLRQVSCRELEQQIAQAEVHHQEHHQSEERLLATVNSDLDMMQQNEAWGVEARALLESLTSTPPDGYGAESSILYCPYCRQSEVRDEFPVEHREDCPWLKAHAFLAR